jgi:hypothetical protein
LVFLPDYLRSVKDKLVVENTERKQPLIKLTHGERVFEFCFDPLHGGALCSINIRNITTSHPNFHFSVVQYKKIGDHFAPEKLRIITKNGDHKNLITLSNINKEVTPSDFVWSSEIPNHTEVTKRDAKHLKFEWKDGEIVPIIDSGAEALRGQKFLKGPGSSRFWMFVVGLILIAAIVVTKIYQRKKAASDTPATSEEEE